jgi:hypothetical protein
MFGIQQLADYGTAHPIVARLSLQTQELLPFFNLTAKQQEEVFGLFFSGLQPKLMTCSRIMEQLTVEVRKHQKEIDEKGIGFQAQGRVYTLPSILDLQHRAETFLYNGKSVLRDLTDLFSIIFSKDFKKEARFDKVSQWAKKEFGPNDSLTRMLEHDANTWIKKMVSMRNAVEHPGGYSGILHIENFTSMKEGTIILVVEPRWNLNTEEKIPIVYEMNVFVTNLLALCEDTLILSLEKFKRDFPIMIVEIPEEERDPKCPKRLKMAMDESRINNLAKRLER